MMSDLSPSKRRRTGSSIEMTPEQVTVAQWPAGALPLEIFNQIVNYLPRSSVQSMRLVNKEFESKVSHYLFRVVVLPFRPDIYGISLEPELAASQSVPMDIVLRGSVKLQDEGMKAFKDFGEKINKFAMSFEFDEDQLAYPPAKSDQECITSFWGVYRWPFRKYNRYAQLEGLEQAADETGTMTGALRCITNANELGLSIDGGLGWIAGPDINQQAAQRDERLPVFGESTFAPEPEYVAMPQGFDMFEVAEELFSNIDSTIPAIRAALRQAGYDGNALDESVQLLVQEDGYLERLTRGETVRNPSDLNWKILARVAAQQRETASALLNTGSDVSDGTGSDVGDDDETSPATPTTPAVADDGEESREDEQFALKPNNLTSAQREMLLEIEWAQRAFMQSYVIAIIDNTETFQNIQALTIARLPSRHLPILSRSDFWDSLPGLNTLSMGVIPDWRDVIKLPTSWVQDDKVLPSQAVAIVYRILADHILHRENIKTLHFEWIGGGEEAQGMFARNQHILPAPLTPLALDMLRVHHHVHPELLSFPYLEHLSLKNCWITPHVMARLALGLGESVLQSLTFNSVSLTAPIPYDLQFNITPANRAYAGHAQVMVNTAALHGQFIVVPAGLPNNLQPPPPTFFPAQNQPPTWLARPRHNSWAHFINILTPGKTLADMKYDRGYGGPPVQSPKTSLTKLTFESCGYVRLPLDLYQYMLDPPDTQTAGGILGRRVEELERIMMKSDDPAQAAIVNYIDDDESQTLVEGFELTLDWDSSRSSLAAETLLDGITNPGRGRFSGTIDVGPTSSFPMDVS